MPPFFFVKTRTIYNIYIIRNLVALPKKKHLLEKPKEINFVNKLYIADAAVRGRAKNQMFVNNNIHI